MAAVTCVERVEVLGGAVSALAAREEDEAERGGENGAAGSGTSPRPRRRLVGHSLPESTMFGLSSIALGLGPLLDELGEHAWSVRDVTLRLCSMVCSPSMRPPARRWAPSPASWDSAANRASAWALTRMQVVGRHARADGDDRAPFGEPRAQLAVRRESLAEAVEPFGDLLPWCARECLGTGIDLDARDDRPAREEGRERGPVGSRTGGWSRRTGWPR